MFLEELLKGLHRSIYRYPEVLRYLYSRQVTDEEIKIHELGFNKIIKVPEDSNPERADFMEECRKGRKIENKLIFPFKDALGYPIGFVGRSIENKEFKVYVTNEAKFKGFFFGLPQALPHIYRERKVFLVEGCFDYLALAKVYPNTVATLTAGLSDAQYDFLMLYCNKIITVFDSDRAGEYAKKEAGYRPHVVGVSLGFKDPAKYLEEVKLKKFKEAVIKRVSGIVGL
jgi:DNA primase